MSGRRMIEWFFPSLLSNVFMTDKNIIGKYLLEYLAPLDSIHNCPEISFEIDLETTASSTTMTSTFLSTETITIRQPNLLLATNFGILVGLVGGGWLLFYTRAQQKLPKLQQHHHQQRPHQLIGSTGRSSGWWWSMAFIFFALMNISALLLHCLLPSPPSVAAQEASSASASVPPFYYYHNISLSSQICWILDCIFTGCSSTFLSIASILEMKQQQILQYMIQLFRNTMPFKNKASSSSSSFLNFIVMVVANLKDYLTFRLILQIHILYVCISIILFKTCQITILLELCYVVPMHVATISVTVWFLLQCLVASDYSTSNNSFLGTKQQEEHENLLIQRKKNDGDYSNDEISKVRSLSTTKKGTTTHAAAYCFGCFIVYIVGGIITVSGILLEANQCRCGSDTSHHNHGADRTGSWSDNISITKFDWISASACTFYGIDVAFVGIFLLFRLQNA